MTTSKQVVDELTYRNYRFNREMNPEITWERWAKVYGEDETKALEQRFQREKQAA